MEVDDATSPLEEDNTSSAGRRTRHPSRRNPSKLSIAAAEEDNPSHHHSPLKKVELKDKSNKEEEEETLNDSCLTGTPLHLLVSGSDEDDDDDDADEETSSQRRRAAAYIRRQLLASPVANQDDKEDGADVSDGEKEPESGTSLKRKHYHVRRSGSEECLLGFDEQSGEAELTTQETEPLKNPPTNTVSPSDSPRATKKLKQSPVAEHMESSIKTSPKSSSLIASPPLKDSPQVVTLLPKHEIKSPEQQQLAKPHIVADTEETNGGSAGGGTPLNVRPSSASTAAALAPGTPIPTSKPKPLSARDDFYKKPFEYGWKRELVWRANMETSKDKADVYFITPGGKKLRTRSDIAPLLEGDLTLEHFSFAREPLGVGPELETVRSAKPSSRVSVTAATLAAASTPAIIGKRISKPKGPKGASPPPQGWTPTRALKVNNAALLSSSTGSSRHHGGGSSYPSTPPSSRSSASNAATSKSSKTKKTVTALPAEHSDNGANTAGSSHEPCTISCALVPGQVPQLQCVKCLCLFHHECVGLNRMQCDYRLAGDVNKGREYICKACLPTMETLNVASVSKTPTVSTQPNVKLAAATLTDNSFPQTIAVVKGKKYVMVAKPIAPPRLEHTTTVVPAPANDIENDLKEINELISEIRNNRKQSAVQLDAAFQPHNNVATISTTAAVEQSNKVFATNFFANVSFAYDALLCIMKYLKIHERPRAAGVCKLWHLAAKDTSLWHTVRMKNSKVCNWAGFTAALRRGETKNLDLRKMLLPSMRGDEMWLDFLEHIGTVCSLESIDMCRCSARVVDSLFQSKMKLRILNAVAINDEAFNIEHVGLLGEQLEELRLRTCEPGVLLGDLLPLQSLTQLGHLSLTGIRDLGTKGVEVLADLTALQTLELGECGDFDSTFADVVLPKLTQLQRLRLENGTVAGCCTLEILESVAGLPKLAQLELVNFDIRPGFEEKLRHCTNINKMLLIPTYISQSATTNQIVLCAVQQVADSLRVFTWGVTIELLRVTALYVDQCEESTKKEKHHFDECIPVLKPVPGAPPPDENDEDDEQTDSDVNKLTNVACLTDDEKMDAGTVVPQIEILPLDKVESILTENLPLTKFTIIKVPYHVTCKQQLVE